MLPGSPLCESLDVKVPRFTPAPGWDEAPRPVSGRLSSEDPGLSGILLPPLLGSLPGLLAVLPVLLGTYLVPGLVRDGGAPHATQSPRDLALSLLSWVMRRFSSLRSGLCSYSRRFCSLASTSAGVGSTRGFGFFTFWLVAI